MVFVCLFLLARGFLGFAGFPLDKCITVLYGGVIGRAARYRKGPVMAVEIATGVRGCWDCLTLSANGPGELDPGTVERVLAGLAEFGVGAEFHADTDPDTGDFIDSGFTWQPCQVCGLDLGHDYVAGVVSWDGGRA